MIDFLLKVAVIFATGVGGVSGIVAIVLKFSESFIEKKIDKKHNEQLAILQANIDKKQYISQVRFDTEFKVYRDLSRKFGQMILEMNAYVLGNVRTKDNISRLKQIAYEAVSELYASAPFIQKELYTSFAEIYDICRDIISTLQDEYVDECLEKKVNMVYNKYNNVIDAVRNYTSKLEVI